MICCHGNILQHDDFTKKVSPGVLLMFVVNAFNINPKIKQTVCPQSIILIKVFMFLNTIGSHLKEKFEYVR